MSPSLTLSLSPTFSLSVSLNPFLSLSLFLSLSHSLPLYISISFSRSIYFSLSILASVYLCLSRSLLSLSLPPSFAPPYPDQGFHQDFHEGNHRGYLLWKPWVSHSSSSLYCFLFSILVRMQWIGLQEQCQKMHRTA